MSRLLGIVVLPAVFIGGLFAAGIAAVGMGFIPAPVWHWAWPALVALAFLTFSVTLFLAGARVWLWPLGTGFLVQTVGVILLVTEEFESPWTPLLYTLVAVGIVLLVMGVLRLVSTIRSKRLERMMSQSDEEEIRRKMVDALRKLERAVGRRNAVYELPWFLLFGRAAVGKTTAIKNSGIGLPMKEDRLKGRGGNVTIEFFFTNEMIFLDTPGKWVMEGASEDLKNWTEVFSLLRRHRRRRPLDGLVVVVAADDLLQNSAEELHEQAANIREVMDLVHEELKFRVPVYLIISKCDLIEGFTKFFKGIPAQRRHEILGWSNADPNRGGHRRLIHRAFPKVVRRLQAYRLEMLARIASTTAARELFFFTEEFKRLEDPLGVFLNVLFQDDRYHEPPVFRGFYFTSGTQGEGSPLGQAMAELAGTLGVPAVPSLAAGGDGESKRSYFLLELFRDLMVGDEGLIGRTAVHWFRRRRDAMLVVFMPAVLAAGLLTFSGISMWRNHSLYNEIRTDVPNVSQQLVELRGEPLGYSIPRALEQTERLRSYHRRLDSIDPFRRLGMRRAADLKERTFDLFRDGLMGSVMEPTFAEAERFATDPTGTCSDRADVFYSIVWLRQGNRREWADDLRGFEQIWGLPEEETAAARKELASQFGYLLAETPKPGEFLPGISLVDVAQSIQEGCNARGAGSPMEQYRQLQSECSNPGTSQARDCYAKLQKILNLHGEDYVRLQNHIQALVTGLESIGDEVDGADDARKIVSTISIPEIKTNECLSEFNSEIIPAIQEYLQGDDDLIEQCRVRYRDSGRKVVITKVMAEQNALLEERTAALSSTLADFGQKCQQALADRFILDPDLPSKLGRSWRRNACQGIKIERAPAPPPPPRLVVFQKPNGISRKYTKTAWRDKLEDWEEAKALAEEPEFEAERRERLSTLRADVRAYADRYAGFWETYLASLKLKPSGGSTTGWLEKLSTTGEYAELIRPAADAASAKSDEQLFQGFGERMEAFGDLASFSKGGISEYQDMLRELAGILKKCGEDRNYWREFQARVVNRQDNELAEARTWVNRTAGGNLAGGALKELLLTPLDAAETYVRSVNLARVHWDEVRDGYEKLADRFPFHPEANPELEGADVDDVIDLFGQKSGSVHYLQQIAANRLTEEAQDWLQRATVLSEILFEDGTDKFRTIRVQVAAEPPTIDPPEHERKYQVSEIWLSFGSSSREVRESPEEFRDKDIGLDLFGDIASTRASLSLTVNERKGMLGRTFGANYVKGKPQTIHRILGAWAPIRLFSEGMPQGRPARGDRLRPSYTLEVEVSKKKTAIVSLNLEAEAKGIDLLVELVRYGFPQPPANPFRGN